MSKQTIAVTEERTVVRCDWCGNDSEVEMFLIAKKRKEMEE